MKMDDLSYIPEAFRGEIEDIPRRCRRWCYDGDGGDGDGGGSSGGGVDFGGFGAIGGDGSGTGIDADFGDPSVTNDQGGVIGDIDFGGGSTGFDASGASAGVGGFGGTGFGAGGPSFDPSALQAQIDALTQQLTGLTSLQSQFDETRGLEAQRFGAAQALEAQRDARAFGALEPFAAAGRGASGQIITTAKGLDEQLAEIFGSGSFKNLRGERTRALQGGLAAGGLRRSGAGFNALADVPTELGFGIAKDLFGRRQDVANRGFQAAGQQAQLRAPGLQESLGGFSQLAGIDIAGLDAATRQQIAQLQADTQLETARIGGDAAEGSSTGNLLGTALGVGGSLFFSDRALKTNVEQIGTNGALAVYKWDWIDGVPDCVSECPTVGYMADEVERLYPDCVGEFGGFKTVDYPEVNARMGGI